MEHLTAVTLLFAVKAEIETLVHMSYDIDVLEKQTVNKNLPPLHIISTEHCYK